MSTIYKSIQIALDKKLQSVESTLPIVWENTSYIPTVGTPYLKSHLLMNETFALTLGQSGYDHYYGIYQIDVMYPIGEGWGNYLTKVDTICSAFYKTQATYNSIEVKIWRSWRGPLLEEYFSNTNTQTRWCKVPISVSFSCYHAT